MSGNGWLREWRRWLIWNDGRTAPPWPDHLIALRQSVAKIAGDDEREHDTGEGGFEPKTAASQPPWPVNVGIDDAVLGDTRHGDTIDWALGDIPSGMEPNYHPQ